MKAYDNIIHSCSFFTCSVKHLSIHLTMPSYKLMYFDARARAETARMLFKLAGVDFEDYRVDPPKEWAELKQSKCIHVFCYLIVLTEQSDTCKKLLQ